MNPRQRRQLLLAAIFLAPNLLGFSIFTLGPILLSLAGSFTTWSLRPTTPLHFVGLENYAEIFHDPNFYFYLFNTFYLALGLPFSIAGSLLLAVYLSQKLGFRSPRGAMRLAVTAAIISLSGAILLFLVGSPNAGYLLFGLGCISAIGFYGGSIGYRTFFYLPYFTAGAGSILLWMQLYNPNFGLINQVLGDLRHWTGWNIPQPGWLTSTKCLLGFLPLPREFNNGGFGIGAREAMMLMGIWAGVGGNNMILYLAGISSISPELYEASEIDGASGWMKFRFITLPHLAPTTFFIVVMALISSLQGGFEQARLMTEGGPAGITTTLSYYIYTQGFERLDLAYGAAVAWILFALIMTVTLINWRYGNRELND